MKRPARTAAHAAMRSAVAVAIILVIGLGTPVATAENATAAVGKTHYPVSGAGSTWSANAMQQWIRNVFDNYKWKVEFADSGSSAGRQLFAQGTVDFAVSEIPYALAGSDSPDPRPKRQFAYMPIVAGGTAFMYNLVIGGKRVTNLRLSGENVAKIFTGVITKWNDPAIATDNPKLTLPAITIVPVVRSDGSGTTAQLTTWMRDQYPSIWKAYCAKVGKANCGITSSYPTAAGSAFLAQQGSNGVASAVAADKSVGAITYVEYSYALNARFPVAKLLNSGGYYTEPKASAVAVALLGSRINQDPNSPDYLTQNLRNVYTNKDPRTYPLSSYSYMIIPTALEADFTENKGLTLADFAAYFLCEGQQQAEVLGYSPLPINLAKSGLEQVRKIPGGNTAGKDISKCNNPTFSPDGSNKLAATAPQPAACDKKGVDQCLTGTGGASGTATPPSSSGGGGGSTGGTGGGGGGGSTGGTEGGTGGGGGDPDVVSVDGEPQGLAGGGEPVVAGLPVDVPQKSVSTSSLLWMFAAVGGVILATLLPPVIAKRRATVLAAGPRGSPGRKARPQRAPRIHLRAPFSKRGRADSTLGDQ